MYNTIAMAYIYSDRTREDDLHALPNVEVFEVSDKDASEEMPRGWYWQSCFPGCLPDGEPFGPFSSEEEARNDVYDID